MLKADKIPAQKNYGLLNNRWASHRCYKEEHQPRVGMGATYYAWSDRYPLTVIEVNKNWNNKGYDIIVCQRDNEKVKKDENGKVIGDYYNGDLQYEYIQNPEGTKYYLRSYNYFSVDKDKSPDGVWTKVYLEVYYNKMTERWNKKDDQINIGFGVKEAYTDPTF